MVFDQPINLLFYSIVIDAVILSVDISVKMKFYEGLKEKQIYS